MEVVPFPTSIKVVVVDHARPSTSDRENVDDNDVSNAEEKRNCRRACWKTLGNAWPKDVWISSRMERPHVPLGMLMAPEDGESTTTTTNHQRGGFWGFLARTGMRRVAKASLRRALRRRLTKKAVKSLAKKTLKKAVPAALSGDVSTSIGTS